MANQEWTFGTITDPNLLEQAASNNVYEAAAIATAACGLGNSIPDDVAADAQLVCPLCQSTWDIGMAGIYGWMTDNAQRVCEGTCPACRACTIQVTVTIPTKQSPPTMYFVATVSACVAGRNPKKLGLRITRVH